MDAIVDAFGEQNGLIEKAKWFLRDQTLNL